MQSHRRCAPPRSPKSDACTPARFSSRELSALHAACECMSKPSPACPCTMAGPTTYVWPGPAAESLAGQHQ
eukprot:5672951-Prymnesium_polylepis.1